MKISSLVTAAVLTHGCGADEGPATALPDAVSGKQANDPGDTASPKSEDAPVDRTDAAATAMAVLTAYRGKRIGKMAVLCNKGNKGLFAEIAKQGVSHPRNSSVFTGWRWNSVRNWGGKFDESDNLVNIWQPSGSVRSLRWKWRSLPWCGKTARGASRTLTVRMRAISNR